MSSQNTKAFTLIELSIVLVIIGLIVGGVLVGRDLIAAAAVRAQISQIEKYQTSVNVFRGKYNNYLPGDIPEPDATNFGLSSRGIYPAQGDGNGVIEGRTDNCNGCAYYGAVYGAGETVMFWKDLGQLRLIDESLTAASSTIVPGSDLSDSAIARYFPIGKIGQNNSVYVWSSGGLNYYGISYVTKIANGTAVSTLYSTPALTVAQAYAIDKKLDDGIPQLGKVTAQYANTGGSKIHWASGGGVDGGNYWQSVPPTSITCYDNNNNNANTFQYSISQNNGNGLNCALSFQFQ